ncbi:MAG: glycosyltransferase [Gemmataceae bacterium]|nr:glycosyltransferase [Gemmataceae bacterium]
MHVVHLAASTFFGGPERQMLELATHLPADVRSSFVLFAENGGAAAFRDELLRHRLDVHVLLHDTPRLLRTRLELIERLRTLSPHVLCCHGYKADLLGLSAARRLGIPVVAVSRGWTGESLKVRLYDRLDRWALRRMDHVVCVSWGQARKVRAAGVRAQRLSVIHNAIRLDRFATRDERYGDHLRGFFAKPVSHVVLAAGRLSPEKGFAVLVNAAQRLRARLPEMGLVIFGDGPLRPVLQRQIDSLGLSGQVVLAGHRRDLDAFLPHAHVLALASFTEGLPNVILEAFAAGVPVVATDVGGNRELVHDGINGRLVPPGRGDALAEAIESVLQSEPGRRQMGERGRQLVAVEFTFAAQARAYRHLFARLIRRRAVA